MLFISKTIVVAGVTGAVSPDTTVSDKRLNLIILPAATHETINSPLNQDLADIIVDIAYQSGRFNIVSIDDVGEMSVEEKYSRNAYAGDSIIIRIGKEFGCDEALIIDAVNFSQVGVPPSETDDEEEEDRNILEQIIDGLLSGDSDEDFSYNIQTILSVNIRNIDLHTGEYFDDINLTVSHTGGDLKDSRGNAFNKFRFLMENELLMVYQLVSEVIAIDGNDIQIRLGKNLGIRKRTLFEIFEPDKIRIVEGEEITTPGRSVGLACVEQVRDTLNLSRVVRQWRPIGAGYRVYEFHSSVNAFQIYASPAFPSDHFFIGGQFHFNTLSDVEFGINFRYIQIKDSYNETDHGFGVGGHAGFSILNIPTMILRIKAGIDVDLPFKKDDDGRVATAPLFSGLVGLSSSFMLSKKTDFEVSAGYRLSTRSSSWTYSEEEDTYDAYWVESPPSVDLSGFYLAAGFKFLIF